MYFSTMHYVGPLIFQFYAEEKKDKSFTLEILCGKSSRETCLQTESKGQIIPQIWAPNAANMNADEASLAVTCAITDIFLFLYILKLIFVFFFFFK